MSSTVDFPISVKTTRCATRTQSRLVPGPHGCTRETITIPIVDRPATDKTATR